MLGVDLSLKDSERVQLLEIESIVERIMSSDDADEDIKILSSKHNIVKSYMTNIRMDNMKQEDVDYVREVNEKVWNVLDPVYDALIAMGKEHMNQWYKRVKVLSGAIDPKLYDYQEDLAEYLLEAIIRNELTDTIYTLLLSRGSGKTYTLSVVGAFVTLFHSSYILHNSSTDFVMIISAPTQKQLSSFYDNISDFLSICRANLIISAKQTDSSELGLVQVKDNTNEVQIHTNTGARYATIFYRIGADSIEGLHCNLLLSDESKFLSKRAITQNMLPTTTTRGGVFLMLSSASDKYCEFQEYCKKNKELDIEDHEEYGAKLRKLGSDETKNLYFYGRRHYQNHWEYMVRSDPKYMTAISTHLSAVNGNRDDVSFATQRDNLFLSRKSSSFFDINELEEINIFKRYNAMDYLNNPRYILVAGWDIAVTGDISDLTIKAIDNGYGLDRKSTLIARFVINTTKSKQSDSVYNQIPTIMRYIKAYKISAIAIDESGVGKSAGDYLKEEIRKDRTCTLDEYNVFSVVIGRKNRLEMLEFYYNRIQSGMEIFPPIPDHLRSEDSQRHAYIDSNGKYDEDSCYARFIHEHTKFGRIELEDESTKLIKIEYRQSNERYLHDDSIFGSGLASYCLILNPNIHSSGEVPDVGVVSKGKLFRRSWRKYV